MVGELMRKEGKEHLGDQRPHLGVVLLNRLGRLLQSPDREGV